jgi:sigma-B regulation protein RsbQ
MIRLSQCQLNDPSHYDGGYDESTIQELLQLMKKNYIGWADFFAPEVMKNEDKPELTEELEESFCSTDPVIAHEFAKATFLADNREDLPKIDVPTLIIQCEDDSIAPLRIGKYVHSNIKESTLEVLSANGHCPHMSHPQKTIEAIENYLEQNLTKS